MKKGTKIILAVAAVMLIVGATLINIARGRGENALDYFNSGVSFSAADGLINIGIDQKDYTVCENGEENFSAAEVKRLSLNWTAGTVKVEPYDGKTLVIREKASGALTDRQRMRWQLNGGTLSVLFCANGENKVPEKTLTVLLPRDLRLQSVDVDGISASVTLTGLEVAAEIDVDTTSGAISVRDCACGSLDTDTISGRVDIEAAAVSGAIDIDTTSGAVTLKACASRELDVETVSGAVTVEASAVNGGVDVDTTNGSVTLRKSSVGGDVDIATVSGAVEMSFEGLPKSVDVDTSSGDVRLAFPKGTAVDLNYDTTSGRLSGSINSVKGGLPVDVDTTSGDLNIEEN